MSNLKDYIKWRVDIAFSKETVSAIDMLIFSQIVYTPLEKIARADYGKPLRELYLSVYPDGAPGGSTFVNDDLFSLWQFVLDSKRFGDVRLVDFLSKFDAAQQMQFAAATFEYGDIVVVAFRGTDTSVIGWKEDFNMGFESPIPSQTEAVSYVDSLFSVNPFAAAGRDANQKSVLKSLHAVSSLFTHKTQVYLCGHSKGGNLAMYGGAFCKKPEKITGIYSFDGPGFDDDVLESKEWAAVEDKVFSFIPESSVVGLLLGYYKRYTIVKSDNIGILQHNPFFWHIEGGRFVEAPETSFSSRLFSGTMHRFLESCPKAQRRVLIETAFKIIEASGATSAMDIPSGLLRHFGEVRQILQSVPQEDKQALSEMGRIFAEAGSASFSTLIGRILRG